MTEGPAVGDPVLPPDATKHVRLGSTIFEIAGVSPTDPYFLSLGEDFEPEFQRICESHVMEDYVCADVGANIGIKSLLLSQYAARGRVISIEAAPPIADLLAKNVGKSGRTNIRVVRTAVGDEDGVTNFATDSAYGHIASQGVEVPIHTLTSITEQLALTRLDFVKIDVEGYEFPILRNSVDLLNRFESLVLMEFNSWCQIMHSGINPKEFATWIFENFSSIFMIRKQPEIDYLQPLQSNNPAAIEFLHTNLVKDGAVTDLLLTNSEGRLAVRNDSASCSLAQSKSNPGRFGLSRIARILRKGR